MKFSEESRIGELLKNEQTSLIFNRHLPELAGSAHLDFLKWQTLGKVIHSNDEWGFLPERAVALLAELADVEVLEEDSGEIAPLEVAEDESVVRASAPVSMTRRGGRWDVFEFTLHGPALGNPFTDVTLHAEFTHGECTLRVPGFYDGEGIYRIRFMPDTYGMWLYRTYSNARSLDGIQGEFYCSETRDWNHGPVRVKDTFHFSYEDGTRYIPVGTTCYAWTHQGEQLEEETLHTLAASPFNKIRMCVFPKSYAYNSNEPEHYPFEGSLQDGWDFTRLNPIFFRHLEQRIEQLGDLGIEADLILFHPYDRWGFQEMKKGVDDRYLNYMVARLAAYRNVWWSLANEYDFMWAKREEDWERFASIIKANDPYNHLISIHNGLTFYDYERSWVTHCSIQRIDLYKTAESTNEWRDRWNKPIVIDECAYEGDIDAGWGNITGEEMVRRFWEGAIRGGYVGHGETYVHDEDILWWSKGGILHGASPKRIEFLKTLMEEGPAHGWNPIPGAWDAPSAGIRDEYILHYYGFNQPRFKVYRMKPGIQYHVDVIDTWNMTVTRQEGVYEGIFRVELPGRPYMAVRLTKMNE
ncbi:DUF5605 domain-containing protein [Cohnella sp.]|uniref:DUF5605 domain-containing protein n=1 Tax=Cohnella sp. TaxID=1883426 RepID=UPI003565E7B7